MCRFSVKAKNQSIETYYNDKKGSPDVIDFLNRTIGIYDAVIRISQTYLICTFSRIKRLPNVQKFFDLNNPFYILVASGELNSLGFFFYQNQNKCSSSSAKSSLIF